VAIFVQKAPVFEKNVALFEKIVATFGDRVFTLLCIEKRRHAQ
jgi:hypothetical protein